MEKEIEELFIELAGNFKYLTQENRLKLIIAFQKLDKDIQYRLSLRPECAPLAKNLYGKIRIPTTETEEVAYSRPSMLELERESDLKKLGYHTYKNTTERRLILIEKAIPQLGLQQVINKLSGFIYYRKRQKGGASKYQRAINIWESDLEYLKKMFHLI